MASKKILGLVSFLLIGLGSFAQQEGSSYNVLDSSVVPAKRLPQHTEFMANNYAFPAKPRNQWELGVKVGAFSISGDVRNQFPGFGAGLHLRKSLGYVFSLRGELGYGTTKGMNFQPSLHYTKNPAWAPYVGSGNYVFYNYKSTVWDASLQAVATLNNIRFHKAKSGFNVYVFAGIGGLIHDTKVDALNGNTPYNFTNIINKYGMSGFVYENRKDIKSDLKDLFDGEYETEGETDPGQPMFLGEPFRFNVTTGIGVQFKLSRNVSLAIEDRLNFSGSDLLDGNQWQENGLAAIAQTRGNDVTNFASVGLNFQLGGKHTEPLWWLNPLDYAYNEINKPNHMKLPTPVLPDSDGDGVPDQFDLEPNTPAGVPVDTRGVARDTDGDGVPDYMDKELITPTQCQPVDADGVGKCPPPDCCKVLDSLMEYGFRGRCNIGDLPSITFSGRSVTLSNDAKALLAGVAQRLRDNAACRIAVVGYCATNKAQQQLSWDRVNAVINYLIENEGIGSDRFIFKYGQEGGDCNTVDLRDGTQEDGPTTVPAPHPNLRRTR